MTLSGFGIRLMLASSSELADFPSSSVLERISSNVEYYQWNRLDLDFSFWEVFVCLFIWVFFFVVVCFLAVPHGIWNLGFPTRDWTCVPPTEEVWCPNHWTAKEFPDYFTSVMFPLSFFILVIWLFSLLSLAKILPILLIFLKITSWFYWFFFYYLSLYFASLCS